MQLYNPGMPLLVTALLAFVTNLQAPAAAPPSEADVKAHAAAIVAAIAAKDFARIEADFDDKVKTALPAGRFGAGFDTLALQVGTLKRCGENVRVRTIADKQMVIQACEFERARLDFQVAFDTSNRISGIGFRPAASAVPYV